MVVVVVVKVLHTDSAPWCPYQPFTVVAACHHNAVLWPDRNGTDRFGSVVASQGLDGFRCEYVVCYTGPVLRAGPDVSVCQRTVECILSCDVGATVCLEQA